jgi:hypothetical protein
MAAPGLILSASYQTITPRPAFGPTVVIPENSSPCNVAEPSPTKPAAPCADSVAANTAELENQSFAGIAQAMGAEGIVVDKLDEVGSALKRAIDAQMNEGKTTVVEIMCTRELGDPFRKDALSKPVRFLEKYQDYV